MPPEPNTVSVRCAGCHAWQGSVGERAAHEAGCALIRLQTDIAHARGLVSAHRPAEAEQEFQHILMDHYRYKLSRKECFPLGEIFVDALAEGLPGGLSLAVDMAMLSQVMGQQAYEKAYTLLTAAERDGMFGGAAAAAACQDRNPTHVLGTLAARERFKAGQHKRAVALLAKMPDVESTRLFGCGAAAGWRRWLTYCTRQGGYWEQALTRR